MAMRCARAERQRWTDRTVGAHKNVGSTQAAFFCGTVIHEQRRTAFENVNARHSIRGAEMTRQGLERASGCKSQAWWSIEKASVKQGSSERSLAADVRLLVVELGARRPVVLTAAWVRSIGIQGTS